MTRVRIRLCRKCNELKPLINFVKDKSIKSGYGTKCKKCHRQQMKERYSTEEGKQRRSKIKRKHRSTENGKLKHIEETRRHRKQHPEKHNARNSIYRALKSGKLVKPDKCQVNTCKCKGRIESHHHDYSKRLDVEWFCVYHHSMIPT